MQPYYTRGDIRLFFGRCEEVLPQLGAGSVGVTLTDPPYSEHVHSKSKRGDTNRSDHIATVREFGFDCRSPDSRRFAAAEFARLTRRWVLIFSDVESAHLWREDLECAGLRYVRTGAWIKPDAAPQFTGDRPAAAMESIVIAHPFERSRWN